ncbi:hypothetical protein DQ04_03781030 [Trypanosoma grayi]|uniref:hypothetical protein n=1 Tax=Trypanosoma grayi TaxID=71804 RepID=UPI0004F480DB|nr:hypothetical protein DQ04_03781030 [Trypanosoma grayi]KEG10383.1 hypothetical protein DQ04_03781030 [Trypanosoma grayi]
MGADKADGILEQCPGDALGDAISKVFRHLLANLLLEPDNPKFRAVRHENAIIRKALEQLPDAVADSLFTTIGFELECNPNSGMIYIFKGDVQQLKEADRFFSELEEKLQNKKAMDIQLHLTALKARGDTQGRERREQILQQIKDDAAHRQEEATIREANTTQDLLNTDDFSSVENLKEKARLTLLNTGRVRNCLFEGRHFALRRMLHGRVYACKEGCVNECLEAHWHLLSGKNLIYAYVAHLTPDASTMIHLGVEHGYQYNSLPGTEHFGKTVHFSAKRVNDADGTIDYLRHPNQPAAVCIYCGVSFSQLFL